MGPEERIKSFAGGIAAVENIAARARTERLLLLVPVMAVGALGLVFGLSRFIVVMMESLRQSPIHLPEIGMLLVIVGSVAMLISLASSAFGFLIGLALIGVARIWRAKRRQGIQLSAALWPHHR